MKYEIHFNYEPKTKIKGNIKNNLFLKDLLYDFDILIGGEVIIKHVSEKVDNVVLVFNDIISANDYLHRLIQNVPIIEILYFGQK